LEQNSFAAQQVCTQTVWLAVQVGPLGTHRPTRVPDASVCLEQISVELQQACTQGTWSAAQAPWENTHRPLTHTSGKEHWLSAVQMHCPAAHTGWSVGQTLSHPPQCFGSVEVSTHAEPQAV
jgi:hypothetical protein